MSSTALWCFSASFRKCLYGSLAAFGEAANGEQHQVLLGFEPYGPSFRIAFAQKMANAVAQLSQGAVLGGGDVRSHGSSVS
jgi:hypothetical protein